MPIIILPIKVQNYSSIGKKNKKIKKIKEQNKTNKLISENKQLKTKQIKMYCIIISTKGK